MVLTAVAALGIDKGFYAPLRRRGAKPVTLLVASIGVTLIIQGLIRLVFGTGNWSFFDYGETKQLIRIDLSALGGTRPLSFTQPQLLMVVVTVIAIVALHFFLSRSRLGKGMRAMADNADLAQVSGINTALVVRTTWIIGGALACLAGTMLALDVQLRPELAYGAIAGGFLLGFAEALAVFNWTQILRPVEHLLPFGLTLPGNLALVPTEYKITVAFVILVIVLLARPTGIFKGAST